MTDTPIPYGSEALEQLRKLAADKDVDICAYLAKNGIDVAANLRRIYEVMQDAERLEDKKEAAKKLFELDFKPEKMARWGKSKYFRLGIMPDNGKEESGDGLGTAPVT